MSRWITGYVQQMIRDVVSLGIRNPPRSKLLRGREATWTIIQSPSVRENEDLVELLV